MGLAQVNWTPQGLEATDALAQIRALPHGARVTVMLHGFRFDPAVPSRSPHSHILSFNPPKSCWKAISWPKHLQMDRGDAHLGLAYGWPALGNLRRVAARAFEAGAGLGELISRIHAVRPDLTLSIIAHSLGARVGLAALRAAPAHAVARVALLSGAEYRDIARTTLQDGAGATARTFNLHSAENLAFDTAFRLAVPAPHAFALPLIAGLRTEERWTNIRFDCPKTRAHLAAHGYRFPPPKTRICHWSAYMRPGLFPLYRRLLRSEPLNPAAVAPNPRNLSGLGRAGQGGALFKRLEPLR